MSDLTGKTERYTKRKIRPLVLTGREFRISPQVKGTANLLVWERRGNS